MRARRPTPIPDSRIALERGSALRRVIVTCILLTGVASGLLAESALPARAPDIAGGSAASLDDCVRQFESTYHNVRTLRAGFTQEYTAWGRTRVESGEVYLSRGGKMRWEYQKPEEKLFVSDGKDVLLYVPSEKQLTRTPLKASDDVRVPLELLVSHVNLRRAFSKIEFADSKPAVAHDRLLRAYPKHAQEQEYRDVVVELTPTFDIRRLVITYPDETTMQFTFDRVARNAALSPSLFEFTPPPGTEVIQQ